MNKSNSYMDLKFGNYSGRSCRKIIGFREILCSLWKSVLEGYSVLLLVVKLLKILYMKIWRNSFF